MTTNCLPFRLQRFLAVVACLLLVCLWGGRAEAAQCHLATAQGSTGPANWQTYCWLDFSSFNNTTARSAAGQNFSYSLPDGTTMTFNLKISGPTLTSATSPSWTGAAIGNTAFLGIAGEPILYQTGAGTSVMTISNITLTPPPGSGAITAYMFVAADAESSNDGETLRFQTNGGAWSVLDRAGPTSGNTYPSISGTGTSTFTETGVGGTVGAYIVGSTTPTQVVTTMVGSGLQGAMFAVRFASIRLNMQIQGTRVNAADQFKFDIESTAGGSVLATGTSSGTGLGPFTAASLSTASALPLTLSQTMASGSANTISHYQSTLSCTNATSGSSTPLPGGVVTTSYNFGALQFGDNILCTFTNIAHPHLQLSKTLGGFFGRRWATDQFTMNIQQGETVLGTTTTTGSGSSIANGTTPQVQGVAGTTYAFVEEPAGTTVLAQYTATMTCTNAYSGSSTVLPTAPGGSVVPQLGDVISCTIQNTRRGANATLGITKTSTVLSDPINNTVNPLFIPGAIIRYSINIANSGTLTVQSNSIFIVDRLPAEVEVGTAASPTFTQGTPASGLSFNPATDIRYSNSATPPANFAACTYAPVSAYDPAVRHVCINPKGTMAASSGSPPNFTISINARMK